MKRIFCILAVCVIVVLAASVSFGQTGCQNSATTTGFYNYIGPYDACGTVVYHTFTGTVNSSTPQTILCHLEVNGASSDPYYISSREYNIGDNVTITWTTTVSSTWDHQIWIAIPVGGSTAGFTNPTYTVRYYESAAE